MDKENVIKKVKKRMNAYSSDKDYYEYLNKWYTTSFNPLIDAIDIECISWEARASVGATAYYQLSHAGVKEGYHVISWCGCLAWNKIKVSRLKKERQVCPLCGAPTLKVIYYGRGSHPLEGSPNGEYYLDSDEWRYTSRFRYI